MSPPDCFLTCFLTTAQFDLSVTSLKVASEGIFWNSTLGGELSASSVPPTAPDHSLCKTIAGVLVKLSKLAFHNSGMFYFCSWEEHINLHGGENRDTSFEHGLTLGFVSQPRRRTIATFIDPLKLWVNHFS